MISVAAGKKIAREPNKIKEKERNVDRGEEFVALLARHECELFGYLTALVQNVADAEDLLQECSLILWRKFDEFEPGSNFFSWACQVARLTAMNFLRHRGRSRVRFSDEMVAQLAETRVAHAGWFESRLQALSDCMAKLKLSDQRLIQLCYEGERPIYQVADELGRTADSVYHSLSRIRYTLSKCIDRALLQGGDR